MRHKLVYLALLLSFQLAFAAQEVTAPRVKVIFDGPAEAAYAERVAAEAERALDLLIPLFGYAPPPITLRLEATTDVYNALASPLPRPSVGLRLLFPTEVSLGYRAKDELRLLLLHELTHLLQFSYLAGRGNGLRFGLVGENIANVPPAWLVEGLAVWDESEFTTGGRRDDALTRGLVESAVLAGTAPSLADASLATYGAWPGGQTEYLFGVGFTSYLIRHHGFDAIKRALALHNAAGFIRPFEGSWRLAVGTDLEAEWRAWQREVLGKAQVRARKVAKTQRAGTLETDSGWYTRAPALSPDATQLAWAGWPAAIMVAKVAGGTLGQRRVLLDNRLVGSLEWLGAHTLLYARPVRRPEHTYSEVFTLDTRTGRETQLTSGARARLPAPLPGGCILYVTDEGTRSSLMQFCPGQPVRARWQGAVGVHLVGLATSRRGQVAVSVWQRGWTDLALLQGGALRYLTRDPAQDLEPSWRGENALLFRSDRTHVSDSTPNDVLDNVFELYALRLADKRLARLSETVGGAFTPEAGRGGTWFAALGGGGYNLAWLAGASPVSEVQAPAARRLAPPRRVAPDFSVSSYDPLGSLGVYGWLPTNAGVSLTPLGAFAELSLVAQDDSLDHNVRTTLGFDSSLTALAGFYGFTRYDFGGGLALQATPPPLRYAAQVGVWPLAPHLSGRLESVAGAKVAVTVRLPEDRILISWGLEAGLVHVLGQTSGVVLDARAEGAVAAGQTDTWGYRTEGWRVAATGLLSATGSAPSLGAWGDGSYTRPLEGPVSMVGRLEFGLRAGYRPAWPIPLNVNADVAALATLGSTRSFLLKVRVGDGLYALERVTLEPRLRSWLDSAVHLGGDLTVSLDSVINYGAPVSLSGTLGYSSGVWTRLAVRLPLQGL